jgi:hypothetical protein
MNDLKNFIHGQEGTHYFCQKKMEELGNKAGCCGCNKHKCINTQKTNDWEEEYETIMRYWYLGDEPEGHQQLKAFIQKQIDEAEYKGYEQGLKAGKIIAKEGFEDGKK